MSFLDFHSDSSPGLFEIRPEYSFTAARLSARILERRIVISRLSIPLIHQMPSLLTLSTNLPPNPVIA